jgi:CheY-like chemotaxis protein
MKDRPSKILIVDDEEANLQLIQEVLAGDHCVISKARDGIEALDKFEKFQPDLILLDLLLPRLDGLEVCGHLKRDPRTRPVPVIILTSLDELEARRDAYQCGAEDFLTKPFDVQVLRHQIHSLLRESHRRQAIAGVRRDLTEVLGRLERAKNSEAEAGRPLISSALDVCKRLDQALAEL